MQSSIDVMHIALFNYQESKKFSLKDRLANRTNPEQITKSDELHWLYPIESRLAYAHLFILGMDRYRKMIEILISAANQSHIKKCEEEFNDFFPRFVFLRNSIQHYESRIIKEAKNEQNKLVNIGPKQLATSQMDIKNAFLVGTMVGDWLVYDSTKREGVEVSFDTLSTICDQFSNLIKTFTWDGSPPQKPVAVYHNFHSNRLSPERQNPP